MTPQASHPQVLTISLLDAEDNVVRHVAREEPYFDWVGSVVYGVTGGTEYSQHSSLEEAKRAAEASLPATD